MAKSRTMAALSLRSLCYTALACLIISPALSSAFTVVPHHTLGALSGSFARCSAPTCGNSLIPRLRRSHVAQSPRALAEFAAPVADLLQGVGQLLADASAEAVPLGQPAYSQASYYATLGLFVLSFPGAWSLVKRSVQYKPIRKVYETEGPAAGKAVRQTAGEITGYFRALNFTPEPTKDVVTFRGTMGRSQSQALYLTFCTFVSLAALAIVLTIQFPLVPDPKDFSPWYYMTLLSPSAGIYYWTNAAKEITVQMKMEESEDGKTCEITCLGTKEELERFCETMGFQEKGMVRVKSVMETLSEIAD